MSMSAVASPEKVAESMVTVNGGFQPAPIRLGNVVTAWTTTVSTTTTMESTTSSTTSTTTTTFTGGKISYNFYLRRCRQV